MIHNVSGPVNYGDRYYGTIQGSNIGGTGNIVINYHHTANQTAVIYSSETTELDCLVEPSEL